MFVFSCCINEGCGSTNVEKLVGRGFRPNPPSQYVELLMLKMVECDTVGPPAPCHPNVAVSKPALPVVSMFRLTSKSKLNMLFGVHVSDLFVSNKKPRLFAQSAT